MLKLCETVLSINFARDPYIFGLKIFKTRNCMCTRQRYIREAKESRKLGKSKLSYKLFNICLLPSYFTSLWIRTRDSTKLKLFIFVSASCSNLHSKPALKWNKTSLHQWTTHLFLNEAYFSIFPWIFYHKLQSTSRKTISLCLLLENGGWFH